MGKHPYWGSSLHYQQCLTGPIGPSVIYGGVFSLIDALQGHRLTLRGVGTYMGGIYVYNALQCPMEAIHGRRSLLHNVASGGLIGYVGVSAGRLGIPFVDPAVFWRHPWLRMEWAAFAVYGGIAGALGMLGGKQL